MIKVIKTGYANVFSCAACDLEVLGDPKQEESFAKGAAPKIAKIEEHETVGEGDDVTPSQRRTVPKRAKTKARTKAEVPPVKHEAAGRNPSPTILRKALLIRDVMDKLYPEPPIPLDHTASSHAKLTLDLSIDLPNPSLSPRTYSAREVQVDHVMFVVGDDILAQNSCLSVAE